MKETLFVLFLTVAIGIGVAGGIFVTAPLNAGVRFTDKPESISGVYALRGVMTGADEERREVMIETVLPYPSAQVQTLRVGFDHRTIFRSPSGDAAPSMELIRAEFIKKEVYLSMERSAEGRLHALLVSLRFTDTEHPLPR